MKGRWFRATAVALILSGGLAACGGGHSNRSTFNPTTPSGSFQSRFGTQFANFFNTSTTAEAVHPQTTDVPALNLMAEPIDN